MINKFFKIILTGMVFYFLVLIQNSFLNAIVNFNFLILFLLILNLIEDPESNLGLWAAFFTGFFMDLSSIHFLGFWTLSLAGGALLIKLLFSKVFKFPYLSFIPKI